ncbi:hypothetical protein OQJ13_04280 [Legionella sp. PATHC035]|uniref:hypothetical protein n=1 Tax=Legionella sp. PATHC035 TaxID=2992040 RepID=UPI0022433410|nr:hypothetical protein [Legionella sp. PATHC035]MCW8408185.1 hypothetical protein [Legionella sp. PATHC035]
MMPYPFLPRNLLQLEEDVTIYYRSKIEYFTPKVTFNFALFTEVYHSIQSLPLDDKKIALMERFQQNVFAPINNFHPKIFYTFNFAPYIAQYKPLIEQLNVLQKQASHLYTHYFDAERHSFDWQKFHTVRTQIENLPMSADKIQLMQFFEFNVLNTICLVEPKVFSSFSFSSQLAAEELPLPSQSFH